jgi:hypothetical protein
MALSPAFVRPPRSDATHLTKLPLGAIRRFCTFLEPFRFPTRFLVDEFGCRVPAFSTLSTPSTVLVLNCLESSLIWRDLATRPFGLPFAFVEGCNRVTDAPEIDETTLWAHLPQPSSVPNPARQ